PGETANPPLARAAVLAASVLPAAGARSADRLPGLGCWPCRLGPGKCDQSARGYIAAIPRPAADRPPRRRTCRRRGPAALSVDTTDPTAADRSRSDSRDAHMPNDTAATASWPARARAARRTTGQTRPALP